MAGVLERIIIRVVLEDKAFAKQMQRMGARLRDAKGKFSTLDNAANATGSRMAKFTGVARGLSLRMEAFTRKFEMWALGVMFFGMAIQRTFTRIATVGVDSFMKITEGSTLAGQGITTLAVNFELLKFTVGNAIATALLPLLPTILDIISVIKDWIETNPKLFTSLTIMGILVGGLMFFIGMFTLGLTSTIAGLGKLAAFLTAPAIVGGLMAIRVAIAAAAISIIAHINAVGAALLANPIIIIIALIIVAIIALKLAWENNWLNIRQVTGVIFKGIANAFFFLVEAAQIMVNGLLVLWNGLLTGIELIANGIILIVNTIGGAFAWLTGQRFEPIPPASLSAFKADLVGINRTIDEFQRRTGQAIFDFGEDLIAQGEHINFLKQTGQFTPFGLGDLFAGFIPPGAPGQGLQQFAPSQNISIENLNVSTFPSAQAGGPNAFIEWLNEVLAANGLNPPG